MNSATAANKNGQRFTTKTKYVENFSSGFHEMYREHIPTCPVCWPTDRHHCCRVYSCHVIHRRTQIRM